MLGSDTIPRARRIKTTNDNIRSNMNTSVDDDVDDNDDDDFLAAGRPAFPFAI